MEGYCRSGVNQFVTEKQGKVAWDHFIVEELLDFSNEEEGDRHMAAEEDGRSEETGGNCSADSCANSFSGVGSDDLFSNEIVYRSLADAGLSGDLCEPYEELAELEWLSNFVEESFSSEELHKQQLISGLKCTSSQPTHGTNYPFATVIATANEPPPFTTEAPVPGKARSKRARTAACNWSSRLFLSTTSTEKEPSPAVLLPSPNGRKCHHCATDKTPQWRAGPMGPKTLCNACGVRFKSGRLVPEYRPAASPTFVLSKHSNSHRKVLELRRQKEIQPILPVFNSAAAAGR